MLWVAGAGSYFCSGDQLQPPPPTTSPTPPWAESSRAASLHLLDFLCKAKVFLHGLPSLALGGRANEVTALSSLMTQLIYFKHLKRTPPSANLPAASHSQPAGAGGLPEVCSCILRSRKPPRNPGPSVQRETKASSELWYFHSQNGSLASDVRIMWHRHLR